MLLTKEQFNSRLNSEENLSGIVSSDEGSSHLKVIKWGGHSQKERPHYKLDEEQRITIGSLGKIFPTKDVAEMTGVSQDAVRDLRNGKRGSSGYSPELMAAIDERTESTRKSTYDKAMDKLLSSLGFITDAKMENANARELSGIASNLSKVASNLTPKDATASVGKGVTLILYQPKPSKEEHFDVIEVTAE